MFLAVFNTLDYTKFAFCIIEAQLKYSTVFPYCQHFWRKLFNFVWFAQKTKASEPCSFGAFLCNIHKVNFLCGESCTRTRSIFTDVKMVKYRLIFFENLNTIRNV